MKKIIIAAALLIPIALKAQNGITSDIVEGGKTLVELIKVIRSPRVAAYTNSTPLTDQIDSCSVKNLQISALRTNPEKLLK